MNLLSFGFLMLIVLVSGGIAVFADWLGRKVGKKKLTIRYRRLHLRPRTTAQVSTFLSGFCVSLFTILFISAISSDVRQWIEEGPAALAKLNQTLTELKQAQDAKGRLDNDNYNKRQQLASLQETLGKQKAEVARLDVQAKRFRGQIADYRGKLTAASIQYKRIEGQYTVVQKKLGASQKQLEDAKRNLRLAAVNVKATEQNLKTARASLKTTRASLLMAEEGKTAAVEQYNEMNKREIEVEQKVASLEEDAGRLSAQRDKVQSDLDDARQQLSQVHDDLNQAELAIEQVKIDYQQQQENIMNSAVATSRLQPITFQFGEELSRTPVPPNATLDQALQAIRALVRSAERTALDKGAKARGPIPVAGIFERVDAATGRHYSPDELEDQLAQQIEGKGDEQLLIAISTMNSFRGEPVSLEVAVAQNPVVYRASEVITESRIDGNKDDSTVLSQITNFVSNKVKDQARQDRMIARRGSDEFGSVPASDLYALVARVRATGRTVRLQAVADSETRAGDPLKLFFRLK